MRRLAGVACAIALGAGCTLPGYQGGPGPRSTQYTYPGRALNPDTGLAHSPIPQPAEPVDGGVFVFGLVFADGSTATSVSSHASLAVCERARLDYAALAAARVTEGAAAVATVRCHRAHEPGLLQSR